MAEQDIQIKVTVDASQATVALKGVSQAAGDTAKQTEKVADATQKSQVQIGQFGSALGLAGQAAGKLSPALGGIVTMAGSATGVIQGLTTAGLGPLGLALGVASTAIAIFSTQQSDATAKSKQFNDQMRENTRSLGDFIAKLREQRQLQQTERRLAAGGGTVEEYEAEVARLEARRLLIRQQYGVDSFEYRTLAAGVTAQIERTYQMLQAVEAGGGVVETTIQMEDMPMLVPGTPEFAAWAQQNNRDPRTGAPLPRGRTGGGGGRGGRAAAPAEREDPNAAARAAGEELDRLWAQSETRLQERRARWEEEAAFQAELNEIEANDVRLRLESLERDETEAERLREKNAEEHAERMQAINDAVFQALESALASSVDAWLSGTRSMGEAMQDMVKQVAKSLASEAIIQGLKATAMGLGALAVGSPSAALHFAEAGKWAAVGVAAGVVGAASGAFGGGGGGGGGAPAAATGGPALTAGAREGAGTTVVINWGSSGLVYAADRAQLGRDISGMISEAHGRLGRGM